MSRRRLVPMLLLLSALLAVVVPTIIPFDAPPNPTFFNQIAAYIGWGVLTFLICARLTPSRAQSQVISTRVTFAHIAILSVLGFLIAAACESYWFNGLPLGLTLQSVGVLSATSLIFVVGDLCALEESEPHALRAVFIALVVAGVLGLVIGFIQVFEPRLANDEWLAQSIVPGRAVGNLRQPNHLSTLILWAIAACVWLSEFGRGQIQEPASGTVWRPAAALLIWVFCGGIVWTASRTGMIGIGMLLIWGLIGRNLSSTIRTALRAAPAAYLFTWLLMWYLAHYSGIAFASEARLHDHSDISSSRFALWANTLSLIRTHPWFGIGYGEFNFAWTLTPMPGRPPAFYDNAHNIVLQFVVELGLPIGLLLTCLLVYAFWSLKQRVRASNGNQLLTLQVAFFVVTIIGVHSLLEYPLWYTYFLLPTAFLLGYGLAAQSEQNSESIVHDLTVSQRAWWPLGSMIVCCLIMIALGIYACNQYVITQQVFVGTDSDGLLSTREQRAKENLIFGYWGHYFLATSSRDPTIVLKESNASLHGLLDSGLLAAYARALGVEGQTEKAWYVADRLWEFQDQASKHFFQTECRNFATWDPNRPFQCNPRPKFQTKLTFEDFRGHRTK